MCCSSSCYQAFPRIITRYNRLSSEIIIIILPPPASAQLPPPTITPNYHLQVSPPASAQLSPPSISSNYLLQLSPQSNSSSICPAITSLPLTSNQYLQTLLKPTSTSPSNQYLLKRLHPTLHGSSNWGGTTFLKPLSKVYRLQNSQHNCIFALKQISGQSRP